MLNTLGGPALFLIAFGLCLLVVAMYLVSKRLTRPDFATLEAVEAVEGVDKLCCVFNIPPNSSSN